MAPLLLRECIWGELLPEVGVFASCSSIDSAKKICTLALRVALSYPVPTHLHRVLGFLLMLCDVLEVFPMIQNAHHV